MIFQNYIEAVLAKGGSLLNESKSNVYLLLKNGGENWWIHVQSDQSGTFSVTCVKEENMNQYIVLSADDIAKEMKANGKATFYGIYFDTDKADIKPESMKHWSRWPNISSQIQGEGLYRGTYRQYRFL